MDSPNQPKVHVPEAAPSLQEAQAMVGGFVERIRIDSKTVMLVNEDGRLKRLPMNLEASDLAGQPIVGDAVVLRGTARKGWG